MIFPPRLIGAFVVLVLLPAWLAIFLGSAALALRERHRPPEARRWWACHGIWVWLAGSLAVGFALTPPHRRGPASGGFLAFWGWLVGALAVQFAIMAGEVLVRSRLSTVGRARRKALRGDLAGAIADVEVALGPHLGTIAPGPAVAPAVAADPWAPPASAEPPRGRTALATRLNLLGWLEAQRGDWARALALFERADGLGTGAMLYRTNRAEALIRLGRGGEAGELIDQALAAVPEHNSALSVQLLTEAANHLAALGRPAEARAALGRAERHWRQLGPLRLIYRPQLLPKVHAARAALDRSTAGTEVPA